MRFCGGRSTPAIRAMRAPSAFRKLSLALLVLGVDANYAHHAAPVDHLAFVAYLFYRGPNFHFLLLAEISKPNEFICTGTRCALASGRTAKARRRLCRQPGCG